MFLARMVLFRLHESPRYLVHAGRPQEAVESLQLISRFNGTDLAVTLKDVEDHHPPPLDEFTADSVTTPFLSQKPEDVEAIFDADVNSRPVLESISSSNNLNGTSNGVADYHSTSNSSSTQSSSSYQAVPQNDIEGNKPPSRPHSPADVTSTASRPRLRLRSPPARRTSSVYEKKVCSALPRWLRKPLWGWWDRVTMVLTPEWLRITLLVWAAWFGMSLGESMLAFPPSVFLI